MTPELDKQLCEKYPKIFINRSLNMQESCMFWGLAVGDGWYNIIDIACSVIQSHIDWSIKSAALNEKHNAMVIATRAGDLSLFNKHFKKVDEKWKAEYLNQILVITENEGKDFGTGLRVVTPPIPQLIADQVKEKFGGLRFYHHGGDDFCDGVLSMAENLSYRICEECGAPGKVGGKGWIRTLCPTHIKSGEEEMFRDAVEWKLVDTEDLIDE